MARGLNKVMIIGNLGSEPEVREVSSGVQVANLSVAASESWGKGEERKDHTEWFRVTLWRGLAEVAGKYLHKGDSVYIEGRLRTRKWQDKDGNDRYTTEVEADQMLMVGGKGGGGNSSSRGGEAAVAEEYEDVNFDV